MKITLTVLTLSLFLGLSQAWANEEDGYSRLVSQWKQQHDDLVVEMVRGWLKGASAKSLERQIVTLVNLEVRLATEPSVKHLYLMDMKDSSEPEKVLSHLVRSFMQKNGLIVRTEDFFKDKEFTVERTDGPESDDTASFKFNKWSDQRKDQRKGTPYE